MANYINILQQNLRKSQMATNELRNDPTTNMNDLLLLQEPYLHKNSLSTISTNCVSFHHHYRPLSAIILKRNNLSISHIQNLSNQFFTTVKINTSNKPIILCNVYIPPNQINDSHVDFISNLFENSEFNTNKYPIILTGDLNARHSYWHDHHTNFHGTEIFNLINQLELFISNNNSPTCFTHNGTSHIDLTISNKYAKDLIQNWKTQRLNSISDHSTITFQIKLNNSTSFYFDKFSTWKFNERNVDWSKFLSTFISNFEISNLASVTLINPNDVDNCINKINQTLIEAAYANMTINNKKANINIKSNWWSNEIQSIRKTCLSRRKIYIKATDPIAKSQAKKLYYQSKYKYTKLVNKVKQQSWKDFLSETESSNTWGNTYKILKNKINTKQTNNIPIIDNCLDDKKTSFKTLIDQMFPEDDVSTDNPETLKLRNFIPPPTNINHDHSPFHLQELDFVINNLNIRKAPGIDHISNQMLKTTYPHLKILLLKIFNFCYEKSYFPKTWKISLVTILKKPNKDPNQTNAYRPICLVSNIAKIFEKLINLKLNEQLSSKISPYQFGFKRGSSTIDALQLITDTAIDFKKEKYSAIIAIDLKGAFDNAFWPSIIYNLYNLNIPEKLIILIQKYLQDRQIIAKYSNFNIVKQITKGCPQGSALSPTLWNVMINNLTELDFFRKDNIQIALFADDITLILKEKNKKRMHSLIINSIKTINDWCKNNKLLINFEKTQILNLSNNKIDDIFFDNRKIEYCPNIKILGLTISNHYYKNKLDFSEHIKNIFNKVTKIKNTLLGLIHNTWGINDRKRVNIYKGMIRPMITYASQIYFPYLNKTQKKKLNQIQYSILTKAVKSYKYTSHSCIEVLAQCVKLTDYIETIKILHDFKSGKYISTNTPLDNYRTLPLTYSYFNNFTKTVNPRHTYTNFDYSINIHIQYSQSHSFCQTLINTPTHSNISFVHKFLIDTSNILIYSHCTLHSLTYLINNFNIHNTKILIKSINTTFINQLKCPSFINTAQKQICNILNEKNIYLYIQTTQNNSQFDIDNHIDSTRLNYIQDVKRHKNLMLENKLKQSYLSTNSNFKDYFPSPILPKFFSNNFYANQIFTNNGNFNYYLHKLNIKDTDLCPCGITQTGSHLMYDCSLIGTKFNIPKENVLVNKLNLKNFTLTAENIFYLKKKHNL